MVCLSFLKCCAPYTGGSTSALNQFFPVDFGLRPIMRGSAFRKAPTKRLLVGVTFRYGRHSFMLRPSSLLALLTVRHHHRAPEDVLHPSLPSIRCLLDSRVCYPADWSIAGAGLSPARKTAVVGCTSGRMQAQCWLAAGSRRYRPLIGTTPVPQSAPQSVSYILLYHPGRRDFPGPVGSEDLSS